MSAADAEGADAPSSLTEFVVSDDAKVSFSFSKLG
jgi:hypothetical protein